MIPIMNNIEQAIVYSLRSLLTTELNRFFGQTNDGVPRQMTVQSPIKKWVIVHVSCKWDRFLGLIHLQLK